MNFSWNQKIKFFQAICYIGGLLVLFFNFNVNYLFAAIVAHWFIGHLGVSCVLHRSFSHKSWVPRNKFFLILSHFLAVINVVGSSITWTGTHRTHHMHTDTDKDPHNPVGKSFWVKIKYWFNYWPAHNVNPRIVKDLIRDPYHKFFHKYYFHILIAYMILLLLIDVNLFLYGFLVTTMITLHFISWITVGAHLFGKLSPTNKDTARNSFIMGLYMWGEGWHANHHEKPFSYKFGWNWKQPDIGQFIIKLLAKPESLKSV